jgi:hypothetical protein
MDRQRPEIALEVPQQAFISQGLSSSRTAVRAGATMEERSEAHKSRVLANGGINIQFRNSCSWSDPTGDI